MAEQTTVWITKYALTEGIIQSTAKIETSYVYVKPEHWLTPMQVPKSDWHLSLKAAKDRVEELIRKKEASLRKQLERLESSRTRAMKVVVWPNTEKS